MPKTRKVAVGVEGITFDIANYTPGSTEKCRRLHGHTFRVDVEIEGDINPSDGMVVDFLEIKRYVKDIVDKLDHKVVLPSSDREVTFIKGNFETEIIFLDKPHVTTEYIALEIAERLAEKVRFKRLRVKLYEGSNKYALVELEGE